MSTLTQTSTSALPTNVPSLSQRLSDIAARYTNSRSINSTKPSWDTSGLPTGTNPSKGLPLASWAALQPYQGPQPQLENRQLSNPSLLPIGWQTQGVQNRPPPQQTNNGHSAFYSGAAPTSGGTSQYSQQFTGAAAYNKEAEANFNDYGNQVALREGFFRLMNQFSREPSTDIDALAKAKFLATIDSTKYNKQYVDRLWEATSTWAEGTFKSGEGFGFNGGEKIDSSHMPLDALKCSVATMLIQADDQADTNRERTVTTTLEDQGGYIHRSDTGNTWNINHTYLADGNL